MNININIQNMNITIQPATEIVHTAPEQPTLQDIEERLRKARTANAEAAKAAMIFRRLAYRQRIADKMRAMFGDDTANQFLAGEF